MKKILLATMISAAMVFAAPAAKTVSKAATAKKAVAA